MNHRQQLREANKSAWHLFGLANEARSSGDEELQEACEAALRNIWDLTQLLKARAKS